MSLFDGDQSSFVVFSLLKERCFVAVQNGINGKADRLPLPNESQWIDNVKQQVLRAADQPPGVDVVDALLVQDAWVLQQDLLNMEGELA